MKNTEHHIKILCEIANTQECNCDNILHLLNGSGGGCQLHLRGGRSGGAAASSSSISSTFLSTGDMVISLTFSLYA